MDKKRTDVIWYKFHILNYEINATNTTDENNGLKIRIRRQNIWTCLELQTMWRKIQV